MSMKEPAAAAREEPGTVEPADFVVGKRMGSFTDYEAADKIPEATLQHRFGSVTGKEAFRPNGDSDPYIRDTYGVRVVIRPDTRSWRGYRVHTAFPVNDE
jgi:hypothetical protein